MGQTFALRCWKRGLNGVFKPGFPPEPVPKLRWRKRVFGWGIRVTLVLTGRCWPESRCAESLIDSFWSDMKYRIVSSGSHDFSQKYGVPNVSHRDSSMELSGQLMSLFLVLSTVLNDASG